MRINKIIGVAMLLAFTGIMTVACGQVESAVAAPDVVVNTTVTPGGQFPDTLVVTYEELPKGEINAADYVMTGKAENWLDPSLHDFTAKFKDVKADGNTLTFTFDGFTDKYFFVDSWEVTNEKNEKLNFSSEEISKVVTPVADEFETFTKEDGEDFNYHLFTPTDTSQPQPVVVVFHGYGDINNLLAYRTSVAWAEPEFQAQHPCYVLSPVIDDGDYYNDNKRQDIFEAVYNKLQAMIEAGKVDPSRVYVMGNSFGGMSTIEFMEKYPDFPAGGIALCSAIEYSPSARSGLEKITKIPLWIAQAENDGTISSDYSKNMYNTLTELGDKVVQMKIYSDEEMNAAGGSSDPDSTFSYHHVEMAVMEDEAYGQWLFEQVKPDKKNKTIVIDAGHQQKGNNSKEPIGPGASTTKPKVAGGTKGRTTGYTEYQLTLDIALKLEPLLTAAGYDVVMIRTTNDVNISNSERAQIANENDADAFIRIHANGNDSSSPNGAMTICQTKNNPYNASLHDKSYALSKCVLESFVEATGCRKEYVWETDSMSGINWCNVPVTIIEVGYMTNPTEELRLIDSDYQDKMAEGIFNGIEKYFEQLD